MRRPCSVYVNDFPVVFSSGIVTDRQEGARPGVRERFAVRSLEGAAEMLTVIGAVDSPDAIAWPPPVMVSDGWAGAGATLRTTGCRGRAGKARRRHTGLGDAFRQTR
jgi:hypothetical protein